MSKKSSNFAPDMKKEYFKPILEITVLQPQVVMDGAIPMAGSPTHSTPDAIVQKRWTEVF